uniref:Uncharacterized protein n=1 Tax=Arundo donax TaxID=35708 RepID=A0A0A9GVK1_ARUDO
MIEIPAPKYIKVLQVQQIT